MPPSAGESCPLCSGPLHPEQEWCLRCGAAARTRLASTPNWRTPIAAIVALVALSLGVLTAALVDLAGNSNTTRTNVTKTVTTAPATTPAPLVPTTAAPGTAPQGTTPGATTAPGAVSPTAPKAGTAPGGGTSVGTARTGTTPAPGATGTGPVIPGASNPVRPTSPAR